MKCKCCFAIAQKDGYCEECYSIVKGEKIDRQEDVSQKAPGKPCIDGRQKC
ncbi:MAG: hypothetical protein AB1349_10690 [Elusimicrobiota bacterium]